MKQRTISIYLFMFGFILLFGFFAEWSETLADNNLLNSKRLSLTLCLK